MFSFDVFFKKVHLLVCPVEVSIWWAFGVIIITVFFQKLVNFVTVIDS